MGMGRAGAEGVATDATAAAGNSPAAHVVTTYDGAGAAAARWLTPNAADGAWAEGIADWARTADGVMAAGRDGVG